VSEEYIGGCEEAAKRFGIPFECCTSCHEDADEWGFNLCTIEAIEGYFSVCCEIWKAYENKNKPATSEDRRHVPDDLRHRFYSCGSKD